MVVHQPTPLPGVSASWAQAAHEEAARAWKVGSGAW